MLTKISVRLKLHFQSGGAVPRPREVLVGGRDAKRGKGPEPDILLQVEGCKFAIISTKCLLDEKNLDAFNLWANTGKRKP